MTQSTTTTSSPLDDASVLQQRKPRVLMLTPRVPFPPDRGDRIRAYQILKFLSRRAHVSIACTSDEPVALDQRQAIEELADVVAICRISPAYSRLKGIAALLGGGAVTPSCFYRRSLAATIRRWHEQKPFDAVLTYCTSMIHYARIVTQDERAFRAMLKSETVQTKRPRHVIDLVDVDSYKWLQYAEDARGIKRWVYTIESRRLRRIEAGQQDDFDGIAVVSKAEEDTYCHHVGKHPALNVVRHAVDIEYFTPQLDARTKTLVFVGVLNYKPNVDGIIWFAREVMPQLLARVKDIKLKIVGRHATEQVQDLNSLPGVEVVGSVPDVRKYLSEAATVIAPLRMGRGVQSKVLEAMASGRAVVCSPAAAEGIEAQDGQHLLVADSPSQWVEKIQQVLSDPALRTKLAVMGRAQMEKIYQWQHCLQPLNRLLALTRLPGDIDSEAQDTTYVQTESKAA